MFAKEPSIIVIKIISVNMPVWDRDGNALAVLASQFINWIKN